MQTYNQNREFLVVPQLPAPGINYTPKKNVTNQKEMRACRPLTEARRPRLLGYGILLVVLITAITPQAKGFHFTITNDQREHYQIYSIVLGKINDIVGGPGVFHVSNGDLDYGTTAVSNRSLIDSYFGEDYRWYSLVGNHDAETVADMQWLRNEYHNANGSTKRQPLKNYTNQDGPAGSVETTYSWDYENAHFIALNIFWNGQTDPNSDKAADGDIVPELRDWLAADLADNNKPFVFIFIHEPAFPYNHHYDDSLDQYPAHRNAFWNLLESEKVTVCFNGHTHYKSKHRGDVRGHTYNYPAINSWRTQDPNVAGLYGRVWQLDLGNSGYDPGGIEAGPTLNDWLPPDMQWDGITFTDVIVDSNIATVNIYRDHRHLNEPNLGERFRLADSIILLPSTAPVISGYVLNSNATPFAGIYISANNNGDYDTTDANGYYEIPVPNGWSGVITLKKAEYTFDPNGRSYTNVTGNEPNQDYTTTYTPDLTPPEPDPMIWASLPAATGLTSITMTAMTASDDTPPVMYYFECTNYSAASSSWQTNTTYVANGLSPGTEYTFRVKARDSSAAQNETAWSITASATTLSSPLAWDNFESGGWAGGVGWSGGWSHSGDSAVTTSGSPYQGIYHLRLRSYTGIATRMVNLAGITAANLTFWWKAYSFESGEYATVEVNDGTWHTVLTVNDGQDDYIYHPADIDLSSYNMVSNFQVRIASHMSNTGDYFYIDDIKIAGIVAPPLPGQAGSPSPANDSTGVSITTDLSWTAGLEATSHLVYFGTTSPGDFKGNQVATTFDTGTLTNLTTYYWRIDEKNAGGITTGPVWSFTTVSSSSIPIITSTPITTATVNTPYSYDVDASGVPQPTYSLITSPASMTIDGNTGIIQWTPDSNQLGSNAVIVQAGNSQGSDTQSFSIDVAGITPVITSTAVTAATVNQPYSYDVDASGIPQPTYSLITSPAGMTIDANTGLIRWTPDANQLGLNAVTVKAANSEGSDTQSFTITVLPSDDFDDNRRSAMWRLFVEDYDNMWVSEDANRLNVRATGNVNDIVALYIANGWSFDVNENFAVEVDFRYSKISEQDGWVGITIESNDIYVLISASSDSNESYFYYETVVDGNVVFEQELRDSNDGKLYIWYDAHSNNVYLSHIGYGDANAYNWQTSPDPLQGRWASPVDVAIGGGSDGVYLGPGEAYLDNFKIIRAKLLGWPPATDLDGDGFIGWGDIKIMCEHWLADPNTDPNIEGDINKDEIVNFLDFAELALAW